jgi:hypothetical protein
MVAVLRLTWLSCEEAYLYKGLIYPNDRWERACLVVLVPEMNTKADLKVDASRETWAGRLMSRKQPALLKFLRRIFQLVG